MRARARVDLALRARAAALAGGARGGEVRSPRRTVPPRQESVEPGEDDFLWAFGTILRSRALRTLDQGDAVALVPGG